MPEAEAGVTTRDVIVFVGEFTQVLTRNAFPALVHRVIRPHLHQHASCAARTSIPFLIRGRLDATLNTRPYLLPRTKDGLVDVPEGEAGDVLLPPNVMELTDMPMKELHMFLGPSTPRTQYLAHCAFLSQNPWPPPHVGR